MNKLGCALIVLLAGCQQATNVSVQDCKDDHWYDRGFAAGSSGKPQNEGYNLARACRDYDSDSIEEEFNDGWLAGRRTLCTPANGEIHGQQGKDLVDDCPNDLVAEYQDAWRLGLRTYCKPSEGYKLGQSGASAPSFCPDDLSGAFLEAFYKGRELRLHGSSKERDKHALYFAIEDLNQQILEEDKKLSDLANNKDSTAEARLKQHRAYRDHLIEKRAQLERQAGIS